MIVHENTGGAMGGFGGLTRHAAIGVLLVASALVSVPSVASADVTPSADYQFQETLSSSVGAAPDLSEIGPGASSYGVETVNGAPEKVLEFPADNGLQLTPTTGVTPSSTYTIAVLFRMASVDGGDGWERIADFKNGTTDRGLYVHRGALEFYPHASGAGDAIKPEQYVLAVLTRDGAGRVTGYVNGVSQFSFEDTVGDAVIDSNNTLRFFRDNETGGWEGEASSGAVARIRLYAEALTPAQVAALRGVEESGQVGASVASMSFASQLLGTLSAPQTVTVESVGAATLTIGRVRVAGANLDDFLLSSDSCSYTVLRPGESCAIGVRFAPSASGERTATLTVSSSGPSSPLEIPVSGVGGHALVSCTTIARLRRGLHMTCTSGLVVYNHQIKTGATVAKAALTRGTLVYATGSALRSGVRTRLLLIPRRPIGSGTYMLTLTHPHRRTRETVRIG
jgi:Concanavalin A-like lectin/glucanases superfamily